MPKRDRGYYRKQRIKSIKKRRRLIKEQKYAGAYRGKWIDESEFESGMLAKGHNGWLGRGGADWENDIYPIIKRELEDYNVELWRYEE